MGKKNTHGAIAQEVGTVREIRENARKAWEKKMGNTVIAWEDDHGNKYGVSMAAVESIKLIRHREKGEVTGATLLIYT